MRYDPDWVRGYYAAQGQLEWDRWDRDRIQQVKWEVHLYYLRQYLDSQDRVLEIGAGPGRFTRELARMVRSVVVADLSPLQLDFNRRNANEIGFADAIECWVECDICDLVPHFHENEFDAVVCYGGPLSYVFEERSRAARELLRVVKPNGVVLVSVMSLWGSCHQYYDDVLVLTPKEDRRIIATGDLEKTEANPSAHVCHMFRASELRALWEESGAEVVAMSASNVLTACHADLLEGLDEERWQHVLETELEACREPGCLDMGTHTIAVCRKPAP